MKYHPINVTAPLLKCEAVGTALASLCTDILPLSSHDGAEETLKVLSPFHKATVELCEEKRICTKSNTSAQDAPPHSTVWSHQFTYWLCQTVSWQPTLLILLPPEVFHTRSTALPGKPNIHTPLPDVKHTPMSWRLKEALSEWVWEMFLCFLAQCFNR